ncbi:MAG TPA: glycosyltransferase family 4 protein [Patescibacteria group bacterium]
MHILILNWRDPHHPLAGGAEAMLLEHVHYWQKKGADVTWIGTSFKGAKKHETFEGIKIIRFGSEYTVHLFVFLSFLIGEFKDIDIVIDCFHFIPFFTPLYMKKRKIFALIHEVAGEVWYKNMPFLFAFIGEKLEPLFFKLYKSIRFITVSDSTKMELEGLGVEASQITIIPNGVRIPKRILGKKEKTPTLLFLGRISHDKGIIDVLDAFKQLKKRFPKIKLWIAGKQENKNLLKNLPKDAIYLGFVSEDKKYQLLKKSWILVHPSLKEGWGLTVIEANSVGTPVVGYNVMGLRDSIQNEKTGLLVDSTVNSLIEGVSLLLENKKMYNKLSQNAQNWASRFEWEKSVKKSWQLLKK